MAWMVTEGSWDFYANSGHLESFFDAQAESLLHGRLDVPKEAIRYEAFMRDGKAYGYFGPTPALFRMPLLIFPGMKGHWNRLSMFAASLLMLVVLRQLLRLLEKLYPELPAQRLWRILRPVLILAAAVGSTHFYLLAETKVYEEAIMWGAILSFTHAVCLASYLYEPRGRWLLLSCITAFLAFFARVSSGVGPIFALFVLDAALILPFPALKAYLARELPGRRSVIAACSATVLVTAALWLALNYGKFGIWLTSTPMATNLEYTPERLANIKGSIASLWNVPITAYMYFVPTHIAFTGRFPWLGAVAIPHATLAARFPRAHFDFAEVVVALPVAVPELFFAALAGAVVVLRPAGVRLRTLRIPILGAIAGCGLVFCWGYISIRYLHDLFPWLAVGTGAAIAWLLCEGPARFRRPASIAFAVLTLYAMWANFALAFVQQRWYTAPISTERHVATLDLFAASGEGGISGLLSYWTHWRSYLSAGSFGSGNLTLDRAYIRLRPDQPVAKSQGPPPYGAAYRFDVPADGQYELAIRYASDIPRPVILSINGKPVGYACATATGGNTEPFLKWRFAGRHSLARGPVVVELTSNSEFPTLYALRLVRVD